jgi:hypothetical protein
MLDRIATLHENLCSRVLIIISLLTVLFGCCCKPSPSEEVQAVALQLTRPFHKHFQQISGDALHPAAYYTCETYLHPCLSNFKVNKNYSHSNLLQNLSSTQSQKGEKAP